MRRAAAAVAAARVERLGFRFRIKVWGSALEARIKVIM